MPKIKKNSKKKSSNVIPINKRYSRGRKCYSVVINRRPGA